MFKKRFYLALEACLIVLVSLPISSFALASSADASDLSRLHVTWTGSAQLSPKYHLDCFRRTYRFGQKNASTSVQSDASNYFLSLS